MDLYVKYLQSIFQKIIKRLILKQTIFGIQKY